MDDPAIVARVGLRLADAAVDEVTSAWHEPARPTPAGPVVTVVLAHGAGSDLDAPLLTALATTVAAAGHRAVRVNMAYRELRAAGPPPRADRSVADWAAIRTAIATRVGGPVVVGGASYGGRVASMLVAADAGGDGSRVDVASAGAAATVGLLCASYPLHPPRRPSALRTAHLPDIGVPVLVLQGEADPFGSSDEVGRHLAAVPGGATVLPVPGGDHGLHVARTRSADGATHRVAEVVARLGPAIGAWLDQRAA